MREAREREREGRGGGEGEETLSVTEIPYSSSEVNRIDLGMLTVYYVTGNRFSLHRHN